MAATFRTRPWQLAPARPSAASRALLGCSQCGLRLPPWAAAPGAGRGGLLALPPSRVPSGARGYAKPRSQSPQVRAAMRKELTAFRKTGAPGVDSEDNQAGMVMSALDMKLPSTIVAAPLSRAPRSSLADFARYQFLRLKQHAFDAFTLVAFKVASMPSWSRRPRFQIRRSAIVPTAKALHRTMSEALARGDKAALEQVCMGQLFRSLAGAIDARRRGRRLGWELVRYRGRPAIRDHKLAIFPAPPGSPVKQAVLRQAVVEIRSRQRLVEYDDARGGAVVPGSERELDATEYVVLSQTLNATTYAAGEWRLWGTTRETTLADIEEEKAYLKELEEQELEPYKGAAAGGARGKTRA